MLRRFHRIALALALAGAAAVILGPDDSLANGPEIGLDAGHAVPIASTSVSLAEESVVIAIPLDGSPDGPPLVGRMDCVYHLHNPLPRAVRVPMAFVMPQVDFRYGLSRSTDDPAFRLSVRVLPEEYTGAEDTLLVRRLPVSRAAWRDLVTDVPDSLPTWTVPIAAGRTAAVLISSPVTWSGGSDGQRSGIQLTYCTRPARLWKGPVKRATVEFQFGETAAALLRAAPRDSNLTVRVEPKGFAWTNRGVRWQFTNWEPEQDCRVSIDYTAAEPE